MWVKWSSGPDCKLIRLTEKLKHSLFRWRSKFISNVDRVSVCLIALPYSRSMLEAICLQMWTKYSCQHNWYIYLKWQNTKKINSDVMFTVLSEEKKTNPNFLTSHTHAGAQDSGDALHVCPDQMENVDLLQLFLDLLYHFYSCVCEQHYCFTAAHTYSDWFLHQKHQCAFKKLDHHRHPHNLIIGIIRIKGSYDMWERNNTFGILPELVEKI